MARDGIIGLSSLTARARLGVSMPIGRRIFPKIGQIEPSD